MFGRSSALTHFDADAHIVTYHDLAHRAEIGNPQTVIVDDLSDLEASTPESRAALRRLSGLMDAYRIAVSTGWPSSPREIMEVMAVLRPGEFRTDIPVAQRYPANAVTRMTEHAAAYVSRRVAGDPGTDQHQFRRSSVVSLEASDAQLKAVGQVRERPGMSAAAVLAECMEILSAGPQLALSPKIPAALRRAQDGLAAGRKVAVLARCHRSIELLRVTLRHPQTVVLDAATAVRAGVPGCRLALIRFDRELPDLRAFDEVLFLDYPWSTGLIDDCVGPASAPGGPSRVSVLHLSGTLDDRLAMLAARRRETAAVTDPSAYPSEDEIAYLLSYRQQ